MINARRTRATAGRKNIRGQALGAKLKVMSWNVNGLRGRSVELQRFLYKYDVDVALVQETKLPPGDYSFIPGYTIRHVPREDGSCIHGIAAIIKSDVPFQILDEPNVADVDTETQTMTIRIWEKAGKHFVDIVNLYRPPSAHPDNFDANKIKTGNKRIYVADINGHHAEWDDNSDTDNIGRKVIDWIEIHNLRLLNDGRPTYTHNGNGGKSAPDICCTSPDMFPLCDWWLDEDSHGSDHQPMLIQMYIKGRMQVFSGRGKPNFKKANWENFAEAIDEELKRLKLSNVNEVNNGIVKAIKKADELYIPRKNRVKTKPWWDKRMNKLVKERKKLYKKAGNNSEARKLYLEKNRECKNYAMKAKRECFHKKVMGMDYRSGTYDGWKLIRAMQGKTASKNSESISHNNKLLVSDMQKAEAFCSNYASVSRLTQDKRDRQLKRTIREKLRDRRGSQAYENYLVPFTMTQLNSKIRKLPDSKACGDDGITNEHIKHLGQYGRNVLLWLINRSWRTGEIADSWRKATIVPLLKKGKPVNKITSYRPIALTSCIGKLSERLIKQRITALVEDHGLINNNQAGFRSNHSTVTQIGRVAKFLFDGVQERKAKTSVLTLFDFSRAYDKVWRNMLIMKIIDKGIPNQMVHWIKEFLSDRKAKVQFGEATSKYKKMSQGLPQGTVLSPLLFLFFIDDLLDKFSGDCVVSAFADDVAVVSQEDSISKCEEVTQQCVDKMSEWAKVNRMVLAREKCEMMLITTNSKLADYKLNVKLDDVLLNTVKHPRFLGVHFDRCLNFNHHADVIKRASREKIRLLKSLKRAGMREEDALVVFRGIVEATVCYSSEIWLSAACKTARNKIESVQCEGLRVAMGLMRGSSKMAILQEAGEVSVATKADAKAGIHAEKCLRLPEGHPARTATEKPTYRLIRGGRAGQLRLKKTCWTEKAFEMNQELNPMPREDLIVRRPLHEWNIPLVNKIQFKLETKRRISSSNTPEEKREIGEETIREYDDAEVTIWTDGSVKESGGGAGAVVCWKETEERCEQVAPTGRLASSFWSEMNAIYIALKRFNAMCEQDRLIGQEAFEGFEQDRIVVQPRTNLGRRAIPQKVVIFTDSQSSIAKLGGGVDEQDTEVGINIWIELRLLVERGSSVVFQWIPSHVGIAGNEYADTLAAEGTKLCQVRQKVHLKAAKALINRKAREVQGRRYQEAVNQSDGIGKSRGNTKWHAEATGGREFSKATSISENDKRLLHQLRVGECSEVRRTASRFIDGVDEHCPACGEIQTVKHVLVDCKEAGLAHWRRIAWGADEITVREMFEHPNRLLKFWRGVPDRLLWRPLHQGGDPAMAPVSRC